MIRETLNVYMNIIKDTIKKVPAEKYVEVLGLVVVIVMVISYWHQIFLF